MRNPRVLLPYTWQLALVLVPVYFIKTLGLMLYLLRMPHIYIQVSGTDFTAALTVCLSASVMVDLTPLLAAFCPHASSSRGEGLVCAPLDTPTLTDILEGVVSRQYWRTSVRVGGSGDEDDDNPFYKDWGDETRAAMWGALRGCGFLNVPNATGYYHWTDTSTQETKVRVCGVGGV